VQCLDQDKATIKAGLVALSDPSTGSYQSTLQTLAGSMPITSYTGQIGVALSVPSRQQGQAGECLRNHTLPALPCQRFLPLAHCPGMRPLISPPPRSCLQPRTSPPLTSRPALGSSTPPPPT
jgi:hypothetical protein